MTKKCKPYPYYVYDKLKTIFLVSLSSPATERHGINVSTTLPGTSKILTLIPSTYKSKSYFNLTFHPLRK